MAIRLTESRLRQIIREEMAGANSSAAVDAFFDFWGGDFRADWWLPNDNAWSSIRYNSLPNMNNKMGGRFTDEELDAASDEIFERLASGEFGEYVGKNPTGWPGMKPSTNIRRSSGTRPPGEKPLPPAQPFPRGSGTRHRDGTPWK